MSQKISVKISTKISLIFVLFLFLFVAGCTKSTTSVSSNFSNQNSSQQTQNSLETELINNGSRKTNLVALTFDADMTPGMLKEYKSGKIKSWYDQKITEILRKNSVPATIFITGMWAELYPQVVQDLSSDPLFEIGNHSYDHAAFSTPCFGLSETKNKETEITKTQDILTKLTGKTPKYFRFPGGCFKKEDLDLAQKLNIKVVEWDVVSGDSYLKDPQKIVDQVLKKTQNGSIIVMHFQGGPHAPATSSALQKIIDGLKQKGFSFGTVSQLLSSS